MCFFFFHKGQAGSLLAALVQRRNAMQAAVAAQGGNVPMSQGDSVYSQLMPQMNGSMGPMIRPGLGMMGQPNTMVPRSAAGSLPDLNPSGMMGYGMRKGQEEMSSQGQSQGQSQAQAYQKNMYQRLMSEGIAGSSGVTGQWPMTGMMANQMPEANGVTSTSTMSSPGGHSQAMAALYSGMGQSSSDAGGQNVVPGSASYPYYQ